MISVSSTSLFLLLLSGLFMHVKADPHSNAADSDQGCYVRFAEYIPSSWEQEWYANVQAWTPSLCQQLVRDVEKSVSMLTSTHKWMADASENRASRRLADRISRLNSTLTKKGPRHGSQDTFSLARPLNSGGQERNIVDLFSRMIYEEACADESSRLRTYLIEPLVGALRDPMSIPCHALYHPSVRYMIDPSSQSKRNLLIGPAAPFCRGRALDPNNTQWYSGQDPLHPWTRPRNVYVFDMGASLFGRWGNQQDAAAGMYFAESLENHGVEITHYWAFEAARADPLVVWDTVPLRYKHRYTYVNVAVSADEESPYNVWRWIENAARVDDYVIVKLDIDTPLVENRLIQELLNSPPLAALVDEMFFEHHTDIPAMAPWWGTGTGHTLEQTYHIFSGLRSFGIRMHAWP